MAIRQKRENRRRALEQEEGDLATLRGNISRTGQEHKEAQAAVAAQEARLRQIEETRDAHEDAGHVGRRPCLVDEDQAFRGEVKLTVEPFLPLRQDVGAVLLDRMDRRPRPRVRSRQTWEGSVRVGPLAPAGWSIHVRRPKSIAPRKRGREH